MKILREVCPHVFFEDGQLICTETSSFHPQLSNYGTCFVDEVGRFQEFVEKSVSVQYKYGNQTLYKDTIRRSFPAHSVPPPILLQKTPPRVEERD